MSVLVKALIPSKTAEAAQTTQYTSSGVYTIIDKFTAVNYSASAADISVNLVTVAGSAADANVITKSKTLQANEAYTFPEIVGHILTPGSFISTLAGTADSISLRASGREVTQ